MKKALFLVAILSSVIFSGCTPATQNSDTPVLEVEQEAYQPSKEVINELTKVQNDLSLSLMRGDAELAPTYEEFYSTVNGVSESLNTAIEKFENEASNKKISEKITSNLAALKSVSSELQMSLFRGDAELAPTYEDFYKNVLKVQQELEKVLLEFN